MCLKTDRLSVDTVAVQKKRHAIVMILVEISAGKDLAIGDDVMYIVEAGDIRATVLSVFF